MAQSSLDQELAEAIKLDDVGIGEIHPFRKFMDAHFEEVDLNKPLGGLSNLTPLQSCVSATFSMSCRRYYCTEVCALLLEFGGDVQAIYPHVVINGLVNGRYWRIPSFNSIVAYLEDVGDYFIHTDEDFIKKRNTVHAGYDKLMDYDYLLGKEYIQQSFGHVGYFLQRYGSLYNIYYRFDPTDLIVLDNMEELCLVIENDLLSMEWRHYIARAACISTGSDLKVWNMLGIWTKGFNKPEDAHNLIDVDLIIRTAISGNIHAAKTLLPLFQEFVSPAFFQLVIDCALYRSYNNTPMLKYLVTRWQGNPNRRFTECLSGAIGFERNQQTLEYEEFGSHSLATRLQQLYLDFHADHSVERDEQWLDLNTQILNCPDGHRIVRRGWTVLHLECSIGKGPAIDRLIFLIEQGGANPWILSGDDGYFGNMTSLHIALNKSRQLVVDYYISHVMQGNVNALQFTDIGYDTEANEDEDVANNSNEGSVGELLPAPTKITILMLSCMKRFYHSQSLTNLINNHHADVNVEDSNGETILIKLIKAKIIAPLAFFLKIAGSKVGFRCRSKEGYKIEELLVDADPLLLKAIWKYLPISIVKSIKKVAEQKLKALNAGKRKRKEDET